MDMIIGYYCLQISRTPPFLDAIKWLPLLSISRSQSVGQLYDIMKSKMAAYRIFKIENI